MTNPADTTIAVIEANRTIDTVRARQPDVALLATFASVATIIEPELLRRLRLELLPTVDTGCEADLWFSPLVEHASTQAMVLRLPVAEVLRRELGTRDERTAARELVVKSHQGQSEHLQLEELMVWEFVCGRDPTPLLDRVRATLQVGQDSALDTLRWYKRAVHRIPTQASGSQMGDSLSQLATMILDLRVPESVISARSFARAETWLFQARDIPQATVDVSCTTNSIIFALADGVGPSVLEIPNTQPPVLEVEWMAHGVVESQVVALSANGVEVSVGSATTVTLRTLDGQQYRVSIPRYQSPAAAQRRLGAELRALREAAGLTLAQAGQRIERSAATISRFERGKPTPRNVELVGMLDTYDNRSPGLVTHEIRERLLQLAYDARQNQWFDPFRDALSGNMIPDHFVRYIEFESSATDILTYESDLIPGLLQTRAYALSVARFFFSNEMDAEYQRFAEFRIARQEQALWSDRIESLRFVISEVALRRPIASPSDMQEQLRHLSDMLDHRGTSVSVRILQATTIIPAALGGPFVVMILEGDDPHEIVYLETRSGADYLTDAASVQRYDQYFVSLMEAALSEDDSRSLIDEIIRSYS